MGRGARIGAGLAVVATVLVLAAPPVAADPARPTDYRARVLGVAPKPPPGFHVRVVGGDAFLELVAPRGHVVEVPDYSQTATGPRPYLRFRADGVVQRNEHSVAAVLNRSRYGTDGTPPDPALEPRWVEVARDGRYLWHDHRIHWMGGSAPSTDHHGRVDLGGPDGAWVIELEVDGRTTTVTGELVRLDAPPSWPYYGAAVLVAGGFVALAARRTRRREASIGAGAAAASVAVAGAATAAGVGQWKGLPAVASVGPVVALVPALAVGAAVALVLAVSLARRGRPSGGVVGRAALAALAAALGSWAWLRRAVLGAAILPTSLPAGFDRTATALALGLAVGAAVVLVRWPPGRPAARAPA